MRISNLTVINFRGIREVQLTNLGTTIVVAGQNGSGKSCIFDAIRLLKSVYGGYQQNEWQQWMGEFQIQLTNRSSDFTSMFNNPNKELRISCDFTLSQDESSYIASHSNDLLREVIWRSILPEAYEWGGYRMAMFAAQFRQREPEVQARVSELQPMLLEELSRPSIHGECFIPVGGVPALVHNVTLNVVFSTFRPREIGVIDYHGAQRHYSRELVQGVNLNLDANAQQRSQNTLYNSAAKYNNVKSELAASFVRELLAESAGSITPERTTLIGTLEELFNTFFPDKQFMGPRPTSDGSLSFPVRVGNSEHDLDELSAGEKEILYGYLRIRNSAPRNSIILIDEPELHLNPRLIRGLPQFYHEHLGRILNNHIFLVSHSDALLREVVGREGYDVFHMLPCNIVSQNETQLRPLLANADLELALIDLVGDLAAYHPNGKVVIFEGGGDSELDRSVTARLFPELAAGANLISGSNKARVRALHDVLAKAANKGQIPFQFFAVVDRDSDDTLTPQEVNVFSWDVYHIENYFLSPQHILAVLDSLGIGNLTEEEVSDSLRDCARETLPQLMRHELGKFANDCLIGAIDLGTDPKKGDHVRELLDAVNRSIARVKALLDVKLNDSALREQENVTRIRLEQGLADGSWRQTFRGRDILRRFAGRHAPSVSYEAFRNLIISKMRDENFRPRGMERIVNAIMGRGTA